MVPGGSATVEAGGPASAAPEKRTYDSISDARTAKNPIKSNQFDSGVGSQLSICAASSSTTAESGAPPARTASPHIKKPRTRRAERNRAAGPPPNDVARPGGPIRTCDIVRSRTSRGVRLGFQIPNWTPSNPTKHADTARVRGWVHICLCRFMGDQKAENRWGETFLASAGGIFARTSPKKPW